MNKIFVLLSLLLIAGCTQKGIINEGINTTSSITNNTSTMVHAVALSYEMTNSNDSRFQNVTLKLLDEAGEHITGVNVSYTQVDMDFFFDSSNNADAAWSEIVDDKLRYDLLTSDVDERKLEYANVGFNTMLDYPGLWWAQAEPSKGDYQIIDGRMGKEWVEEGWDYEADYPNVRFYRANMGPDFGCVPGRGPEYWVPSWVDYTNKTEFLKYFGDYLREVINRSLVTIGGYDIYEMGLEINDFCKLPWQPEPTSWPLGEDYWVEWVSILKWESDLIKDADPNATISLNLDYMGWDRDKYQASIAPQWIIDEAVKQGVQFDMLGFEIHPASFPGEYQDYSDWKPFFDNMSGYGKPLQLWEYAVRSKGVPEPIPDWCDLCVNYVTNYTEAYQDEVFMSVFKELFNNPDLIGVSVLDYRDLPGPLELYNNEAIHEGSGLLRADRTRKPLYYSLRDFWHSQLINDSGVTPLTFTAVPGIFNLTINGLTYMVHLEKGLNTTVTLNKSVSYFDNWFRQD